MKTKLLISLLVIAIVVLSTIMIATRQSLINARNDLALQEQLNEKLQEEVDEQRIEVDKAHMSLRGALNDLSTANTKLEEVEARLKSYENELFWYKETLGTEVFVGIQPPYRKADFAGVGLDNRQEAVDPTWEELKTFLLDDETDKEIYSDHFPCGAFAEMLHNNAEKAGIKTAFVVVHFKPGFTDSHALNAFRTTDKGLVYIDSTGWQTWEDLLSGRSPFTHYPSDPISWDKVATGLKRNSDLVLTLIFPDPNWYLDPLGLGTVDRIEIYW